MAKAKQGLIRGMGTNRRTEGNHMAGRQCLSGSR